MAPRKAAKSASKALSRGKPPSRRKADARSMMQAFPIRTVAVVVGIAGLAALAVALIGPRRIQDEFVRPLREATLVPLTAAVAPQADRVWAETRPWRDHVSRVLASINTAEVREHLAERLTHWLDRFR